ncbi:MAG: DUF349 domain-containing protein, partial [Bacteroidia bacterium]|nr:DUF349 domain-containing protein [Bacteroidia bacterium]
MLADNSMNFETNEDIQTNNGAETSSPIETETTETQLDSLEKAMQELRLAESQSIIDWITEFLNYPVDKFENEIQKSNLIDIVLLMEQLSQASGIHSVQTKTEILKKQFDELKSKSVSPKEKEEQQDLLNRFMAAYSVCTSQTAESTLLTDTEEIATETNELSEDDLEEHVVENLRKAEAEQLNEVINEFLGYSDDKFEEGVQNSNLLDIVLLMEELSKQNDIKSIQSKVRILKKQFDKIHSKRVKEEEKEEQQRLSARFHAAYSVYTKNKAEFDKQQEAERQKNTELKKQLLEQLKSLIEDVNNIEPVRTIQERWKQIGQVLSSEHENINQTYRHYIDTF